jgi:hypothetical protein
MKAGELVDLRCPLCRTILAQALAGWVGGPFWIKCRRCGYMIRLVPGDAVIVPRGGE